MDHSDSLSRAQWNLSIWNVSPQQDEVNKNILYIFPKIPVNTMNVTEVQMELAEGVQNAESKIIRF